MYFWELELDVNMQVYNAAENSESMNRERSSSSIFYVLQPSSPLLVPLLHSVLSGVRVHVHVQVPQDSSSLSDCMNKASETKLS